MKQPKKDLQGNKTYLSTMSKRYTAFKQLACHSDMWENQNEKFAVFIFF